MPTSLGSTGLTVRRRRTAPIIPCHASAWHDRAVTVAAPPSSHVYPLGTRVNERGRLEIGGCDAVELAREFGTPAYVVAEDDLARSRPSVRRSARDPPRRL